MANFELSHIKAFKNLLAEEGIECDFTATRNMTVFLNEARAEKAREVYEKLVGTGRSFMDDVYYTGEKNAEGVCILFFLSILCWNPADAKLQRYPG